MAAQEAIGVATPIQVRLETPEEFERAAKTLRKDALEKYGLLRNAVRETNLQTWAS